MTRAGASSIFLTLVAGFAQACLANPLAEGVADPATYGPVDERSSTDADDASVAIDTILKDGFEDTPGPGHCDYPNTASDTFVEGEPIPAFSWPMADDLANGMAPLDLVEVACDTDPARSWSGIDFLLFVSFDAWDLASRRHVASIAALEDDFAAERVAIVWVLENDRRGRPGTLSDCTAELRGLATTGFCVGDVDTQPDARAFQGSPFAVFRGFTAIVRRSDMRIEFVTTHGTPSGNENLTGAEVLDALQTL